MNQTPGSGKRTDETVSRGRREVLKEYAGGIIGMERNGFGK
jgi:hypothetical protein